MRNHIGFFLILIVITLGAIIIITWRLKNGHENDTVTREEIIELPETRDTLSRDVVLQFIEAYNNRDTTALSGIFSDPVTWNGEEYALAEFINNSWAERLWISFPDARITPTHMVTDDAYVTLRTEGEMTGASDFLGFDVTGKKIRISEMSLFRVQDGKIVEWWYESDMLGFWKQLGLVEDPVSDR